LVNFYLRSLKIRVEHIVILGLFVYIVFFQTCNTKQDPIIKTVETVRVDSLRIYDTIKTVLRVPYTNVPLINIEPPKGIDLSDTSVFHTKTYVYAKKDSLLDYEIKIEGECEPVDVKIKYDITQLTILDSVYIRDSTHVKELIKKSFISLGGQVIGNENYFGFAPQLFYHHKSGSNFGVGYDVLNKNLQLTYTKKLSLRK
jgi:hypothetical protein